MGHVRSASALERSRDLRRFSGVVDCGDRRGAAPPDKVKAELSGMIRDLGFLHRRIKTHFQRKKNETSQAWQEKSRPPPRSAALPPVPPAESLDRDGVGLQALAADGRGDALAGAGGLCD